MVTRMVFRPAAGETALVLPSGTPDLLS